jgi:metal-responsive CopG/Arc/MetJ family transcriptional regulator
MIINIIVEESKPSKKKKTHKRKTDSFSFQENIVDAFKNHCKDEGKNKSKVVERLVIEYLKQNNVEF